MTEKLMTYALGRGVEYYDMPAIRAVVHEAARNNYRFSSLILGVVEEYPVSNATVAGTRQLAGGDIRR